MTKVPRLDDADEALDGSQVEPVSDKGPKPLGDGLRRTAGTIKELVPED